MADKKIFYFNTKIILIDLKGKNIFFKDDIRMGISPSINKKN